MYIDCKGKPCPEPVVLTIKALKNLPTDEVLEVEIDNDAALENLTRTAKQQGCELFVEDKGDNIYRLEFKKAAESCSACGASKIVEGSDRRPLCIAVGGDLFGQGDPELGKILMKSYLYALTQYEDEDLPDTMLFYNGGARLTIEGSESLQDIKTLESRGVEVLTCGTCLDFYKIKDKLSVGGVTNMYQIALTMSDASRTVRI